MAAAQDAEGSVLNHKQQTQSELGAACRSETSRLIPSDRLPPASPHFLNLPKCYHQHGTMYSDAVGEHFLFKLPHTPNVSFVPGVHGLPKLLTKFLGLEPK